MIQRRLLGALPVFVFLFGMALVTSMAAMELFSGLIILTSLVHFDRSKLKSFFNPTPLHFWAFVFLVFSVLTSLIVNDEFQDLGFNLGWFRWGIFLYCLSYALSLKPGLNHQLLYGICSGLLLASLNGFYQYVTNWDLVRRTTIAYSASSDDHIVRVISFFNLPTTFGYALSMGLFAALFLVPFFS